MKKIPVRIILLLFLLPVSVHALTLNEAIRMAGEHNQALRMSRREIGIREENLKAASRFFQENPVLSADYTGKESSRNSYTIGIGQTFEVRGQRNDREIIARRGIEESRFNARGLWLKLKNKIVQTYIDNWALEQKISLYKEALKKEKALEEYARMRVMNGENSPDILAVATMEFARTQEIFHNLQAKRRALKSKLSTLLGGKEVDEIDPSFKRDFTFPSFPILQSLLRNNPGIKAIEAKIEKAKSLYELTKKNGYFPSIQAGLSAGSDAGERTITASLSIPLPLFNTKRPEAAAAFYQIQQNIDKKSSLMTRLKYRLNVIQANMESLQKEDLFYKKKVLPQIHGYLARFEKRYRNGEIDIFAYENATRRFLQIRKNYIEILQSILSLKSNIKALIGEDDE